MKKEFSKVIRGRLKGSQTLEAAIVIPILLFTIISLMYFVFYLHDRVVLEGCAYHSAMESVFENKSVHSVAKEKLADLNTLTIIPTSTWTEGTRKKTVKYLGKYVAPFAAVEMFMENERISESAYAYEKIKIKNMYAIKIIRNIMAQKIEVTNQNEER